MADHMSPPPGVQVPENKGWFVPVLYFLQSLPFFLVTTTSVTMYKSFGVDNAAIAQWTALLGLPYSYKFLWGPLVELNATKRRWLLTIQLIIAALIILLAVSIQGANFFNISLVVLFALALFGATHDIAADGYYILSLTQKRREALVGFQSTFFRLGRWLATGPLLALAALLGDTNTATLAQKQQAWGISIVCLAILYIGGRIANQSLIVPSPQDIDHKTPWAENKLNIARLLSLLVSFGFLFVAVGALFRLLGHALSSVFTSIKPLPPTEIYFFFTDLTRLFPGASIEATSGILKVPGVEAELYRLAIALPVFIGFGLLARKQTRGTEMGEAFGTFFGQAKIGRILAFMLFYRFGEAMLGSLVPLFLQDTLDTSKGPDPTRGLGFDVNAVGLVNGTFGVFGIILGGILGGWYVSKVGVRKAFWALAAAMNLPNLLYYWASQARPGVDVMSGILFFDQMGYGLGFAGYIVCLMQIASRVPQFRTAHYAIGTGLGATFISLAGILSGELMKNFDFPTIFLIVFCFTIPCLITILLVPLDETQGRGTDLRNLDTQD